MTRRASEAHVGGVRRASCGEAGQGEIGFEGNRRPSAKDRYEPEVIDIYQQTILIIAARHRSRSRPCCCGASSGT